MRLGRIINRFIHLEASGGIALFITAVLALIIDNSPWNVFYHQILGTYFSLQLGN
jgi:Na+:H+ antiporter, NhaA family